MLKENLLSFSDVDRILFWLEMKVSPEHLKEMYSSTADIVDFLKHLYPAYGR